MEILRTQPTTTCSKLSIERLEQGVTYVQSYKDTRTIPGVVRVSLLLTLNILTPWSSVSIVR